MNVLSQHASTVGAYDLDILNLNDENNSILKKIKNNQFDILFLFGQDNLNFKKENTSHRKLFKYTLTTNVSCLYTAFVVCCTS